MANGVLEATVIGTLVRDPERKDWNGQTYCVYSVAVNTFARGVNDVTYVEGSLWGKQVDSFMKIAHKGSTIYATGSLKLKEYEWKGEKRSKLQLSAQNFRIFGGQSPAHEEQPEQPNAYVQQAPSQPVQYQQPTQTQQAHVEGDIPF